MRFFLMFAVILGMNFYVFFRLSRLACADVRLFVPIGLTVVFVAMFALPVLTGAAPLLYRWATAWFFIAVYLLLIFLLMDLLRLVLPIFTRANISLLLNGNRLTLGILAFVLTAVFTYGYLHYRHKERVELSVSIDKQISPMKIVAVSDLHLGYTIGKAELDEWVTLINAEKPDLVLIVGDIKDNSLSPLIEQNMAASLRNIQSKYGVYACAGNHEYIGVPADLENFFQEANITLLRDTSALINNEFYIIGRDDRRNSARKPLAQIADTLDKTKPLILLDHQPYHLEEAEQNGIDLQLSGHTHRGQVLPLSWITDQIYEVSHGYLRKGDSHIYVSSGIGIWGGKFRIGTQSEYVVINIR